MDSDLFLPRVKDAARLCDTTSRPRFLGFLTVAEAAAAENYLKNSGCKYFFFGGYSEAERRYLGIFPDWCEEFEVLYPIKALTFSFRGCDKLTHRDFLGSLMALGITRECVGDILVEEGRAVAFVNTEIADFVKEQVTKVGRVGVDISEGARLPLPSLSELAQFSDTVASSRLDCVVAALINSSRTKASFLIEQGAVAVNSLIVEKTVKPVTNGDRITVRGYGKFIINSLDMRTKKDRLILNYSKYI